MNKNDREWLLKLSFSFSFFAAVFPSDTIFQLLPQPTLSKLYGRWIQLQIPISTFLQLQWERGVSGCAKKGKND
jgi:hypothetical protein